jgi:hypothetical protein
MTFLLIGIAIFSFVMGFMFHIGILFDQNNFDEFCRYRLQSIERQKQKRRKK